MRGVWDQVFHTLVRAAKNEYLMVDSTIVRAHQQAATGRKKGPGSGSGALPRRFDHQDSSAVQRTGRPRGLSAHGWASGRLYPGHLLAGRATSERSAGRQGLRCRCDCAAYRGDGSRAGDPAQSQPQNPTALQSNMYKQRNRIEHCFSKLKHFRRIATRFEKNKRNSHFLVALACSMLLLR